jgi:hypothetical protein
MVEIPPEIKNVIDQQEASLQRIAMWIIGLPREEPGRRNRPCKKGLRGNVSAGFAQSGVGAEVG